MCISTKGISNKLMDGGGITLGHLFGQMQETQGTPHWPAGEGKNLKKATVKGEEVLVNQCVSGYEVLVYLEAEQGAQFIRSRSRRGQTGLRP